MCVNKVLLLYTSLSMEKCCGWTKEKLMRAILCVRWVDGLCQYRRAEETVVCVYI